nr:hypothetical protein [Tanacetum cinerariifolium]
MRYSSTYDDTSVNRVDVIDITCEEFVQDVLDFQYNPKSSNPTFVSDDSIFENDSCKVPIVKSSSLTLTPFGESDFILEEIEDFLNDDSIPDEINDSVFDPEGDIRLIEKLLNADPCLLPPMDLDMLKKTKKRTKSDQNRKKTGSVKECECLAQKLSKQTEFVSKKVHTELLQCFAKVEKHPISLELALQKCKEQVKNDTVCNEKASNVFRKEREQYFKIQDLKAQLQDKNIAISELNKLIETGKGKYVDTNFDRPSVVRQPNAQQIPKPSVLGKPTPFSDSLERRYFPKTKSVLKTNVSEGSSKPVTAQTLPQTAKKAVSNTNVLKPGVYRIDNRTAHTRAPQLPQTVRNTNPRVSTSTGVNHNTN